MARRAAINPSAEDAIVAYLAARGIWEPHPKSPVDEHYQLFFREWARLCTLVIEKAKL